MCGGIRRHNKILAKFGEFKGTEVAFSLGVQGNFKKGNIVTNF